MVHSPTMVLDQIHVHHRDDALIFEEAGHKYRHREKKDMEFTSVTTMTKRIINGFPDHIRKQRFRASVVSVQKKEGKTEEEASKQVQKKWDGARDMGTALHKAMEDLVNDSARKLVEKEYPSWLEALREEGKRITEKEMEERTPKGHEADVLRGDVVRMILWLMEMARLGWNPYRSEWKIWMEGKEEGTGVAGTIDLILRKGRRFLVVDYKRSDKDFLQDSKDGWISPHVSPDTSVLCGKYWEYSFQLGMYSYILEKHYGMNVHGALIVQVGGDKVKAVRKYRTEAKMNLQACRREHPSAQGASEYTVFLKKREGVEYPDTQKSILEHVGFFLEETDEVRDAVGEKKGIKPMDVEELEVGV